MIGRTIGHYEIISRIGAGAMGEVYKARDTRLERIVALKFLPAGAAAREDARERFHREGLAASRLDHPAICTVHDVDVTEDGRPYLCLAYCEGETLAQRIARGTLPLPEALRVARRIAEGLACAHAEGVIHRDLKPANIMLTTDGQVKIVDFGLARLDDHDQLTVDGMMVGTFAYMSPEQAQAQTVDHRTDLWSLGVVLYEMLSGQVPFTAATLAELTGRIAHHAAPNFTIDGSPPPPAVVSVIEHCLAKKPEHRFATAGELADALAAVASQPFGDSPGQSDPTRVIPSPSLRLPWYRRKRTRVALVAGLLLVAIWAGWERFFDGDNRPAGVAVLPVAVVGGGADERAFGDGLTYLLTTYLMELEPFQKSAWVVPSSELRTREVIGTEEARSRLGVPVVVTGMLHLQGDLIRLELRRQSTQLDRHIQWLATPQTKVVTGSRSDLVSWVHQAERALTDLIGWTVPNRNGARRPGWGTLNDAALGQDLTGCGWMMPLRGELDLVAAQRNFAEAVALDPDFARAVAHQAAAIWRGGVDGSGPDLETALGLCREAADMAPDVAGIQFALGRIQQDYGLLDDARASLTRCLELVPSHWPAHYYVARLQVQSGHIAAAESTLQTAVDRRSECAAAYNALGRVLIESGKLDEAAACYQRVVDLTPGNADGFSNLGSIYYYKDRLDEAEAMFQVALALRPEAATYQNLGSVYFYRRRYHDAARMYHAAAELTPNDHSPFGYAAECYHFSGRDPELARSLYAKAADLASAELSARPGDSELAASLASYHVRLGQTDEARRLLDPIIASEPEDAYHLFQIATILEDLDDRAEALRFLELALLAGHSSEEVENYPGLDRLRRDPAYAAIVARMANGDEAEFR